MNEVIQIIINRRSIRKYTAVQISDPELEAILRAGRFAPSGGNNQFARLLVLQRPMLLACLAEVVRNELSRMEEIEGLYSMLLKAIRLSKKGTFVFHYDAPTLIIVANKKGYSNAMADSACMMENMMIASTSLGVSSCWINQLHWLDENPVVRELLRPFGLDDTETICASLSLGYSAISPTAPLARKGNEVIIVK